MGKKQKMKKAATKAAGVAAAVAAAAAAVVDETSSKKNISSNSSSSTNIINSNNKKKNNNKKKGSSINDKTKEDNMQKLLSLAKKMQAMPSGSAAPKRKGHASSSGSGSSATDSEESDTEKGTEMEDDNDSDDNTNFDSTVVDGNATVVNADDDDDNEDDDAITLVQQASASGKQGAGNVVTIPKYSRGEKKARRLLMKLDLERVPNVSRVTMRKAKNVLLCIDQADVYKCPHTKTLIIFGDVRVEDTSNAAAAQAAERYLNDVNVRPAPDKPGLGPIQDEHKVGNDDDEDDEESAAKLDNGQLDEKDIELVIMQSTCSRQKAIKALLKHNSDVVNAIMELTVG